MFNQSENIRIKLLEVEDAEPWAGDLFQKSFGAPLPDFPKHFVLLAGEEANQSLVLGYVHFTKHQNMYLGGGMCVNSAALRKLPKTLRAQLNQQGGVAFTMLSEAVNQLNDCAAVFGYVGHKGAYKIDLAVGFEQTQFTHLIVYWKQPLSPSEQTQVINEANKVGPF